MNQRRNLFADIYLPIISLSSLYIFLDAKIVTAFDWPAIDMGGFFERFYDRNFVLGDFFTNASSSPNPRFIFGYFIIFLANFFDNSWYKTFFFLKIFFVLSIPVLFYLYLVSYLRQNTQDEERLFFAKSIIAIFTIYILSNIEKFAIAWWPPLFYFAAPQTLSLLIGLLAINLWNYSESKKNEFFALSLFFVATLLHPTIGLCLFVFDFIFRFSSSQNSLPRIALRAIFGILIPYSILYFSFTIESQILNVDFVKYYIFDAHPRHYLPSQFGTLDGRAWYFGFAVIASLMLLSLIVGVVRHNRKIISIAGLSLFFYVGCVIAQYFLVEIYQIKIFAQLGISRFLFLGYWLVAGCYGILMLEFCPKVNQATFANQTFRNSYFFESFDLRQCYHKIFDKIYRISNPNFLNRVKPVYWIGAVILINFAIYKTCLDSPRQRLDRESGGLFSWIENHIENDAVILTDVYRMEIPLFAKRATIHGGFPFREDFFAENQLRNLITKNLHRLTYQDLQEISEIYKMHYVVIKSGSKPPSVKKKPIFDNGKYLIYRI